MNIFEPALIKMAEISTDHLTPQTLSMMDEDGPEVTAWIQYRFPYGAFVYCQSDMEGRDLPEDLKAVLIAAKDEGITWIKFDGEGMTVNGLPVYDHQ